MEWLERMNKALIYLDGCMEKEVNIEEAARLAYSSTFHFQRLFHALTGFTVAEYVRKRRLTLAAQELAAGSGRVLDVALKYGYDTPESFSKAFRKVHGISPSAAREPGVSLKAFPRLSFHISLKGDKDMNYKIMDKEAFQVIGKSIRVTTRDGENLRRIPAFWQEVMQDGTHDRLSALAGKMGLLGICMDFDQQQEMITYLIAIEKPEGPTPEGFEEREMPASTWAVFESVGVLPQAIQKVWERIFSEWFPATGYEHAGGPELEVYPDGPNDENYRCEVWVPIIKK